MRYFPLMMVLLTGLCSDTAIVPKPNEVDSPMNDCNPDLCYHWDNNCNGLDLDDNTTEYDIVFVVDTSGSMIR